MRRVGAGRRQPFAESKTAAGRRVRGAPASGRFHGRGGFEEVSLPEAFLPYEHILAALQCLSLVPSASGAIKVKEPFRRLDGNGTTYSWPASMRVVSPCRDASRFKNGRWARLCRAVTGFSGTILRLDRVSPCVVRPPE